MAGIWHCLQYFVFASLFMLNACTESEPVEQERSQNNIHSKANLVIKNQDMRDNSRKEKQNDFPIEYIELRKAVITSDLSGPNGITEWPEPNKKPRVFFDLINCREDSDLVELRPVSGEIEAMELLARRSVMIEYLLNEAGYLAKIIDAPMREYQKRMLAYINDNKNIDDPILPAYYDEWFGDPEPDVDDRPTRELAQLALRLDESRKKYQPKLPPVEVRGECGAGEQPFIIKSNPEGARIWFATHFAYNLCNIRYGDGWDRNRCDRWTEMDPKVPSALSGTYKYQARWPNGKTGRGDRILDGLTPVTDDGSPVVVTIRPD